jgi:endonuclease/exonuclease/phosphatase family metal-dependent hydrolase
VSVSESVTIASLNTRGTPLFGTHRVARSAAIAAAFEETDVDAVCFQEVHSYLHLRLLAARMPSFPHCGYAAAPIGPAGGLATFARHPLAEPVFRRFDAASGAAGLPWRARVMEGLKGSLVTRLTRTGVTVVNTHPSAVHDGDWSSAGRYFRLQRGEYAALARLVNELPVDEPLAVCGDFNAPADSEVHRELIAATGLHDAFAGRCPPTFRADCLPAGEVPHCIDFVLVRGPIIAKQTATMLEAPVELPGGPGYASDHLGLHASLLVSR